MDGAPEVTSKRDSPTGFVDAHVHVWHRGDIGMEWLDGVPDLVPRHAPAEELPDHSGDLRLMGIVLVGAVAGYSATRLLLERARGVGVPAMVVGDIDLTEPDAPDSVAELRRSRYGDALAGIRMSPPPGDDGWATRASASVAAAASDSRGMLVEILTGRAQLPAVLAFAHGSSPIPVVLDHLGGIADDALDDSRWRQSISELSKAGNVNIKLSGWRTPERPGIADNVRFVVDEFGCDRVIFGSDWPMTAQSGHYADTVEATRSVLSWLGTDDQDRVLRANALQLYGFERSAASCRIGATP